MSIKTIGIKVGNMVCTSCESLISDDIKELNGVLEVNASYKKSSVTVKFDDTKCSYAKICSAIENAGYVVEGELTKDNSEKNKNSEIFSIVGVILIAFVIMRLSQNSGAFDMSSKLGSNTTYLMLFVVGLLTSLHCVGMCGGIMMSQSITTISKSKVDSMRPSIMYNLGRVISYTILGGLVGALGSVFSLTMTTQASIAIIAGIFMVIMGFNMAGFSTFRSLNIKLPWSKCKSKNTNSRPFVVGLLNGFMPCGPLQTMQLYALASGSAFKGATSMFIFAIGTVPLMLGFGLVANLMNQNNTKKLMKLSGVIVVVLGIVMANRGLTLLGVNFSPMALMGSNKPVSSNVQINDNNKAKLVNGVQEVRITADASGYNPNVVFVQKGVPTKFIVEGKVITSCNNEIVIPSMNIKKKLTKGETVIEFTPGDKDINYSCWMGMIRGLIKVVDNLDNISQSDISSAQNAAPPAGGGSCCSGGGVGGSAAEPQIYGENISEVPTARLIKKANLSNDTQEITIKGIGIDFEPLVAVLKKGVNSKITFDLTNMDVADGDYTIFDLNYRKVNSFNISGSKGVFQGKFDTAGTYIVLYKDQLVLSFQVEEDMNKVDLEQLRKELIY